MYLILWGPRLLKSSLRVCFERKGQGLCEYTFKRGCYKCQKYVNDPKYYLKIQYSWNYPNLECFFLGIQVRSRGMNDMFGLPRAFCDSKLISTQRPFWSHGGAEHLKIIL